MPARANAPKVLVVDDDVRLRDLLTRYLTEQGFQVAALADTSQLDKKLQRDPPHLIVLDLMLPGEDGLAVCRRLRGAGETVLAGQHQIEDDEMRRIALQLLVELARIGQRGDLETLLGEVSREQVAQARVVVDDEDLRGLRTGRHGESLERWRGARAPARCNRL